MRQTYFITGTDTGVGKTVLTCLLAHFFRHHGVSVAAFKPLCSGGRADARALQSALGGALELDEINPWHFRAAVTPSLAARREKKAVTIDRVLAHLRSRQAAFSVTLVEGAGGLLSPLGRGFDSRDLMHALRATPLIVAANRLGAINHVLLTREALPPHLRRRARVVLMRPAKPDAATADNARLLARWIPQASVFELPWLGSDFDPADSVKLGQVDRTLGHLAGI